MFEYPASPRDHYQGPKRDHRLVCTYLNTSLVIFFLQSYVIINTMFCLFGCTHRPPADVFNQIAQKKKLKPSDYHYNCPQILVPLITWLSAFYSARFSYDSCIIINVHRIISHTCDEFRLNRLQSHLLV